MNWLMFWRNYGRRDSGRVSGFRCNVVSDRSTSSPTDHPAVELDTEFMRRLERLFALRPGEFFWPRMVEELLVLG